uniref:GLOBIN domain-containing protein n=1 Tax=Caenorhabditis tropicalis TaxID=1561998 RepID=A0A1I7U3W9_9PELO
MAMRPKKEPNPLKSELKSIIKWLHTHANNCLDEDANLTKELFFFQHLIVSLKEQLPNVPSRSLQSLLKAIEEPLSIVANLFKGSWLNIHDNSIERLKNEVGSLIDDVARRGVQSHRIFNHYVVRDLEKLFKSLFLSKFQVFVECACVLWKSAVGTKKSIYWGHELRKILTENDFGIHLPAERDPTTALFGESDAENWSDDDEQDPDTRVIDRSGPQIPAAIQVTARQFLQTQKNKIFLFKDDEEENTSINYRFPEKVIKQKFVPRKAKSDSESFAVKSSKRANSETDQKIIEFQALKIHKGTNS